MRLALALAVLAACGNDNALKRRNEAPSIAITAPADGEVFRQGPGLLTLTAIVGDSYDPAEDLAVSVRIGDAEPEAATPAGDGAVSRSVALDAVALGPLALTVTATDTDGATSTATVTVVIEGPLGAPTVTITEPAGDVAATVGDPLAFRGEATDLATAAEALVFAWSSDLDGPLDGAVSAGGASALFTSGLSVGTHVVTLTATDADGEIGQDSVTVLVEEEVREAEPGDLVFSEMMVDPSVAEDEVGEWVELHNTSGAPIDIGGYSFRDDDVDDYTLVGPLLVAPGDYVVLCADMDAAVNGGVPCDAPFLRDYRGGGLALANGEDELVLARPDGVEIDWLHYDDTWYTVGVALGLDPDELDDVVNDDPAYWCDQATVAAPMTEPGTPGAPNDPCDAP